MDIHTVDNVSWWRSRGADLGTGTVTELPPGRSEVVIIGAGLTGVCLALMLARQGRQVTVLEARTVGAGATGGSTAKVSLLQGARLSQVRARHGDEVLADYVAGNRAGQQWLMDELRGRDSVQQATAVSYVQDAANAGLVERELEAATAAGLDAYLVHSCDAPVAFSQGVAVDGQWQIDPVDALSVLVERAQQAGVRVVEGCRVTGLDRRDMSVVTSLGEVKADVVVCAAGAPLFDRAGLFARLEVHRSYAAMLRWHGPVPQQMLLSLDEPSRSYRWARDGDDTVVLVGGRGHQVGAVESEAAQVSELLSWATTVFPNSEPVAWWAAQDYVPTRQLPFVGSLTPGDDRVFVATGYAKWGMTNGVAAALQLSGVLAGEPCEWAEAFDTWSGHEVKSLASTARLNASVTHDLVKDRVAVLKPLDDSLPAEGEGRVGRRGLHSVAQSTVDGCTRDVSAVCSHLGGIVRWNDAERTWDCPLHGSRFAADGTRIEGPAVEDLTPR